MTKLVCGLLGSNFHETPPAPSPPAPDVPSGVLSPSGTQEPQILTGEGPMAGYGM